MTPLPKPSTCQQSWGEVVELVEALVGMGHGAWDTVDPLDLAEAFARVLKPDARTVASWLAEERDWKTREAELLAEVERLGNNLEDQRCDSLEEHEELRAELRHATEQHVAIQNELERVQAEVERLNAVAASLQNSETALALRENELERQRDALADASEKARAILRELELLDDDSDRTFALKRTEVLVEIEAALRISGRIG